MIDIRVDGTEAIVADFTEAPGRVTKAAVRALNRAMLAARTAVVKEMARDTGLKSGDLKNALVSREANWSQAEPRASLSASTQRLPLIVFNAKGPVPSRGQGRGVSWRMQGSSRRVQNAFLATVRGPLPTGISSSGHTGVFVRASGGSTGKSRGAWSMNLPIKQLYGPSLGHVFAKFRPMGVTTALEAFKKNFEHEFAYQAQQGASGAGTD